MKTFTASRASEGNSVFPCKIIVRNASITVRIPGLFQNSDKEIPFEKISEISVDTPLVGYSTITFYTTGIGYVKAHGFTKSEVKEIKRLIESGEGDSSETESESYKSVFFDDEQPEEKPVHRRTTAEIDRDNEEEFEREEQERLQRLEAEKQKRKTLNETNASSVENKPTQTSNNVSPEILKRLEQLEKKEQAATKAIEVREKVEESRQWYTFLKNEVSGNNLNPVILFGLQLRGIVDEHVNKLRTFLTSDDYAGVIDGESADTIMTLLEKFTPLMNEINNAVHPKTLSDAELTPAMKSAYDVLMVSVPQLSNKKPVDMQMKMKKEVAMGIVDAIMKLWAFKNRWPLEMQSDKVRSYLQELSTGF